MKRGIHWIIALVLSLFAVSAMAEVTIPTISKEVGKDGGAFSVNTGGSGSWTATTEADWITLSRASGNAGVSCIYIVGANFSADTRVGTIDIAGNTFTVYQTGYSATISPMTAEAAFEGGSGTISVTTEAGVSWSAKPNVDWLSVTPTSGTSVGSVTYTIAPYTNGTLPRTGTLTVAGKVFSVTQTGTDVILSPTTKTLPSSVGTFEVTVTAQADTAWTVTPNASWISVVDSGYGYGNSTLIVAVGNNPSVLPRTGTVSIGSKTLTIVQSGTANVSLGITPVEATASPIGAYGHVAVYATPDDPWTAEALDPWITVSDGATGAGNGNIAYVVSANPTLEPRTGQVKIAATIPYPEVDISRGLKTWQGFDYGTPRDPEVVGWTHGLWFHVTQSGEIHRLFGFNDGNAALYVNIDDKLVYQDANQMHVFDFVVHTNSYYGLFLVYDGNSTAIYGGERDSNDYEKLLEIQGELELATTGSTTLPSTGKLTYGSVKKSYYWWNRPLNERELFSIPSSTPSPEVPSGTLYANMVSYASLKSRLIQNDTLFRSGAQGRNRNGLSQNAMTGEIYPVAWTNPSSVSSYYVSMNVWAKISGNQTAEQVVLFQMGSYTNFGIWFSAEGLYIRDNAFFGPFSKNILRGTQWHMITLTKHASSLTLFVDGVEQGNAAGSSSRKLYPERWRVFGGDGEVWFDEIETFNVCLTSAQVRELYALEKPLVAFHTVTQGAIEPSISTNEFSFSAAGGDGNVMATVAQNVVWSATKGAEDWLYFTSLTEKSGSGDITFAVGQNTSVDGRTASITVAGLPVTIRQEGLRSQVTYDGTVFGKSSDSGFISVQVENDGTWTASSDASWLTLLDTSGHGSGEVMFVVDDFNTAVASRTATVTIAGKTVEITQRGYELSIDPAVGEVGSNAGAGEIGITAPVDAVWEAIVSADWIVLLGGNMGVGSGTLRYTVADNMTGETRTGKIIISGQEYTVTQHPYLTLTTKVNGSGTVIGAGDYETNERVTLTAVPAEGFAFTHWSGDAVGVEPEVSIVMDMAKTVTAHFIPEDAAERLAEEKAAQGGFYTREQLKALAMGDTVIEVDGESGTVDLTVQLQESANLAGGEWDGVDVGEGGGGVTVDEEGKVHIRVAPKGNTAFYRLVKPGAGEE